MQLTDLKPGMVLKIQESFDKDYNRNVPCYMEFYPINNYDVAALKYTLANETFLNFGISQFCIKATQTTYNMLNHSLKHFYSNLVNLDKRFILLEYYGTCHYAAASNKLGEYSEVFWKIYNPTYGTGFITLIQEQLDKEYLTVLC